MAGLCSLFGFVGILLVSAENQGCNITTFIKVKFPVKGELAESGANLKSCSKKQDFCFPDNKYLWKIYNIIMNALTHSDHAECFEISDPHFSCHQV